jgi:plastocyanin
VIQGDLTAPAGNVRLQAINQGGIVHNLGIRGGPISGDMQPGKGFTLDVGSLAAGTYQLYCDIPGHVEKGMVANLVIT